ncbi:MAG: GntR family transcriptional regulator, partial [Caulobacteraceae bacterium]|nr:GntR family transcriptional regulator [Caulobacteraceae bacterium]
ATPAESVASPFEDWSPELQKARVYEQILLDIILGELPPGGRLDEQALVRRYDAGLAGVRDALGRLALEGLVVRKSRAGTTVAPLDIIEIRQAYEARGLIEPHCAALAAANASSEDVAELRTAFNGAEASIRARDCRAMVAMDQRFHAALARAGRNQTLARIIIPLHHKAARFWIYSMADDTDEERIAEIERHRILAEFIARGDVDGARDAVAGVLGVFSDNLKRMISGGPISGGLAFRGGRPASGPNSNGQDR